MRLPIAAAAALAVLAPARPALAQFGSPFNDAVQIKILNETIRNGITLERQLSDLHSGLDVARQNLSFVRSVYGGVNDLVHFDANTFTKDAQAYFFANNPTLADATSFQEDLRRNGLSGGFNAWAINNQIDEYNRQECENHLESLQAMAQAGGMSPDPGDYPACRRAGWFDFRAQSRRGLLSARTAKAGQGVSDVVEKTLADPRTRDRLAVEPRPSGPSEGVLYSRVANVDPALLNELLHHKARSRMIETQSMALYLRTLDPSKEPSVAALAKVSAASNAATAAELARLNETQSKMAAQQNARIAQEQAEQEAYERERAIRAATFGRMLSNALRDNKPSTERASAP